jgi:hypothetical protein
MRFFEFAQCGVLLQVGFRANIYGERAQVYLFRRAALRALSESPVGVERNPLTLHVSRMQGEGVA